MIFLYEYINFSINSISLLLISSLRRNLTHSSSSGIKVIAIGAVINYILQIIPLLEIYLGRFFESLKDSSELELVKNMSFLCNIFFLIFMPSYLVGRNIILFFEVLPIKEKIIKFIFFFLAMSKGYGGLIPHRLDENFFKITFHKALFFIKVSLLGVIFYSIIQYFINKKVYERKYLLQKREFFEIDTLYFLGLNFIQTQRLMTRLYMNLLGDRDQNPLEYILPIFFGGALSTTFLISLLYLTHIEIVQSKVFFFEKIKKAIYIFLVIQNIHTNLFYLESHTAFFFLHYFPYSVYQRILILFLFSLQFYLFHNKEKYGHLLLPGYFIPLILVNYFFFYKILVSLIGI